MNEWKSLLIIYRDLDAKIRSGLHHRRFVHHLADLEMDDAIWSFDGLPRLIADLTNGAAKMESEIVFAGAPLRSLSERAAGEFWPSPDDVRRELDEFAPARKFDSLLVFWPQHDFVRGESVPGSAWGLGMGASDWSNGATYAAVANAPSAAWKTEARGEVWLHEWLHGVCHHFAQLGHAMPERDADGAELHGYTRSPTRGWCDYYRDLMQGVVSENGKQFGVPATAWIEQPRSFPV